MKWFKFYGQDWLTDMKVKQMSIEDRLCYITLLCLASAADEDGVVRNCDEDAIIKLTDFYDEPHETDNEVSRARGVLKRLEALQIVTLDGNGQVTVRNFSKRQAQNLSNAEKQKRYRKRLKERDLQYSNVTVTQGNNRYPRIDKNRIDKSNYRKRLEEELINQAMRYDDDVRLIRKRRKINQEQNKFLISIGFLWVELATKTLSLSQEELPIKNLYYPIRACYDREGQKWDKVEFEGLFKYFLTSKMPKEEKISFDLCLSEKYVAKYKLAKKSQPQTFASISREVKL